MEVRPQDEIREDMANCSNRIKAIEEELDGMQVDHYELEKQLKEVEMQVIERRGKLDEERARLDNLQVELQCSG
jgi:septal ring factor EnvC (AmiA/AmiB activator)